MLRKKISRDSKASIGRPHPKSQFTPAEDAELKRLVGLYGDDNWETVSQYMYNRNIRQCKERYIKYLSDDINRKPFTQKEDELLIEKYNKYGPRWVVISKYFDRRTDAAVKNRWNVLLRHQNNLNLNRNISSENSSMVPSPASDHDDDDYVPPRRLKSQKKSKEKKLNQKKEEEIPHHQPPMKNPNPAEAHQNYFSFPEFNSFEEEFGIDMDPDLDMFAETLNSEF